jgi:hypothetical protein
LRNTFGRWGPSAENISELLQTEAVSALASAVDHLTVEPSPPAHRRLIVGAWHDRMALREPALALHDRWGGKLDWHDGSHAGHLFSRRVQAVSEQFLRSVNE